MLAASMRILHKIRHRLRVAPPSAYLRGLLLRHKFARAGIIAVQPGRPGVQIINKRGRIECEDVAFFPGVRLECLDGGKIIIGNSTYLNRNTVVIAQQEVRIGRQCKISWDVVIMDTDQHGIADQPAVARPVVIEDDVWIGCRAIILKGVTIGTGAVIGAGAIVTKDVPAGGIITGPAATLRGYVSDLSPVQEDLSRLRADAATTTM